MEVLSSRKPVGPIRAITRVRNNRLMQAREERGVSVRQVADGIGVSVSTYNAVENLSRYPSEEMAIRIAGFFERPVDYLFPDSLKAIQSNKVEREISDEQIAEFVFSQPRQISPEEHLIATEAVSHALSLLSKLQRRVLILRYGLNGERPLMLDEIAERLAVTRQHVCATEQRALANLRCRAAAGLRGVLGHGLRQRGEEFGPLEDDDENDDNDQAIEPEPEPQPEPPQRVTATLPRWFDPFEATRGAFIEAYLRLPPRNKEGNDYEESTADRNGEE